MKNIAKLFVMTFFVLVLIVPPTSVFAQDPPPPPNGGHGGGGSQVPGGGAPIGSGMVLLISLAAGYGGKKVYDFNKQKSVE